jgi:hypothetical protein
MLPAPAVPIASDTTSSSFSGASLAPSQSGVSLLSSDSLQPVSSPSGTPGSISLFSGPSIPNYATDGSPFGAPISIDGYQVSTGWVLFAVVVAIVLISARH